MDSVIIVDDDEEEECEIVDLDSSDNPLLDLSPNMGDLGREDDEYDDGWEM